MLMRKKPRERLNQMNNLEQVLRLNWMELFFLFRISSYCQNVPKSWPSVQTKMLCNSAPYVYASFPQILLLYMKKYVLQRKTCQTIVCATKFSNIACSFDENSCEINQRGMKVAFLLRIRI